MSEAFSPRSLRVRVGIPHYSRDQGGDGRHGSSQPDSRTTRSVALARCLGALLDLQRSPEDCVLNIAARAVQRFVTDPLDGPPLPSLSLQITVCTDGVHQLDDVLSEFLPAIEVRHLSPLNPQELALDCRDLLLGRGPAASDHDRACDADLFLYLEDDLVIRDPLYLDKMAWFLELARHDWVLMPHRYERIHSDGLGVMLVDGPRRNPAQARIQLPDHLARLRLPGQAEVKLEIPGNPHAGTFCLSRVQVERLGSPPLPRAGFVGPLETAATLTAMGRFPVLKAVREQWRFLSLEHAHTGYDLLRQSMPEFRA